MHLVSCLGGGGTGIKFTYQRALASQVQKILLWSVEESQPELAQVLALAIFVQLTSSARNCEALLHNEEVPASLGPPKAPCVPEKANGPR